ncbi:hypothetical protein GC167_02145 [bacterium]|nr:hypothetical protein [bacterium]
MNRFVTGLWVLALWALTGSGTLGAQTTEAAKQKLEKASAQLKAAKTVKIAFTYSLENKRTSPPIQQQEKGTLETMGDRYRLKLMGTEQICDGSFVWLVLHADEEVQKNPVKDGQGNEAMTPLRLLELHRKGFSYKLGGKETIGGKTIEYVVLKPNASEDIQSIQVGIDVKTGLVYSYTQTGTNGTVTRFVVDSIQLNPTLPASRFVFSPKEFPGYYIPR